MNEAVLRRYETALHESNLRDATLEAMLGQYERQRLAANRFQQDAGRPTADETAGLAEEILETLRKKLYPIRVDDRLPGHPLFIRVARNVFRVLFDAPMRIPPRIEFSGLPKGSRAEVQEVSRFGFTVVFYPEEIVIDHFDFIADAEL